MDYAMNHPFIGHHRPRLRDLAQQLFNETDSGQGRAHGPRRGGRGGPGFGGPGMGPGFGGPSMGGPGMGGPGFGGPGFGGRRGGGRRRRGDVRLAALLLIAEEPRNGYQIIQELATRSDGHWKPSSGAVYPALSQLQDEGLIRPSEPDGGKTFEVTDAGRAEAEAAAERPAPWEQGEEGHGPTHELGRAMGQVGQAVGAIAQSRDEALITQATEELAELKRRLYQLLAES